MAQDFSKKIVIAVRADLPLWQQVNAIAHCSAYLGNKLGEPFDTGEYFATADAVSLPRNSQFAIVALAATSQDLATLAPQVRESGLLHLDFIPEMIETTNDAELEQMIAKKTFAELEHLAIGIFGPKDVLKNLTGHLKLWKGT